MEAFPPAFLAPPNQNYVTVHALSAGFLTLPEHLFVQPFIEGARNTVLSLAFLIQHYDTKTSKLERILFDLGLRKDLKNYPVPLQEDLESRQPLITEPDVSDSLAAGGLKPDDIDYVILSHVHWDHVGTPSDFKSSRFIVGSGSLALLESGRNPPPAESHSYFEADLLPAERTTELPSVNQGTDAEVGEGGTIRCSNLPLDVTQPMVEEYFATLSEEHFSSDGSTVKSVELLFGHGGISRGVAMVSFERHDHARRAVDLVNGVRVDGKPLKIELVNDPGAKKQGVFSNVKWEKLGPLPNVIDVFSDGSVYLVDSPGHLDGHLNLLARLGPRKLLYLAGDACHDRRIMRGELEIGMWTNLHGEQCCIHVDKEATLRTIELIVRLEKMGVEVVLAHDSEWLNEERNKKRFWPGKM
jgi:glyoxylase-like metal-dependent hydrolase (beta-lactamase superfamily II)